jgi:hypothetical protein
MITGLAAHAACCIDVIVAMTLDEVGVGWQYNRWTGFDCKEIINTKCNYFSVNLSRSSAIAKSEHKLNYRLVASDLPVRP